MINYSAGMNQLNWCLLLFVCGQLRSLRGGSSADKKSRSRGGGRRCNGKSRKRAEQSGDPKEGKNSIRHASIRSRASSHWSIDFEYGNGVGLRRMALPG